MSLGRRYDVTRYNSLLLRGDTPGRYRKLSDDEIALEWERSRTQTNGNMSPTINDASTADTAISEHQPAKEAAVRPSQSLNVGKKKSKGEKRQKSKSLTGKEDTLLDIPLRQGVVEEDVAIADKSLSSPDDQGRPSSLDVDVTLTASEELKTVSVNDSEQTEVKPVLPIIVSEEKIEKKRGKEKKSKVKDKENPKGNKNTCEVHKNRKHKENRLKRLFDSKQKSVDSMNIPRHCQSCTCDLSVKDGNRSDTSDTSSLSSSHHEDSSHKHSDSNSLSSSPHTESSSPVSTSTPRDKSKNKVSSASEKSSKSSASSTKLKVKPEKPRRASKTPPSTPEPSGSDTKDTPRLQLLPVQMCPPTSNKAPEEEPRVLNESIGGSEGYASDAIESGGLICLTTDDTVLLRDGDSFEVIGGSGFIREPSTDTRTYVCLDEVKKDDLSSMAPDSALGESTHLQPSTKTDQSELSVNTVQPLAEMTTRAGVGVRGSVATRPIITVPLENTMAYHSELAPPAGFKECDSPDVHSEEVLTAPPQFQDKEKINIKLDSPAVQLDLPDERLDLNGDKGIDADDEIRIPHIKTREGDVNKKSEVSFPHMDADIEYSLPLAATPSVDVNVTSCSPQSPDPQVTKQTAEPPADGSDTKPSDGKKITLPVGPYVGIVVVPQDSDSSGTDRSSERGNTKESHREHHTSTSESESSSVTSSSSGGKGKTKTKIEKPKRKGKDKSKKGDKEKVAETVESSSVRPASSPVSSTEKLVMPPTIRRTEKVEDISNTVDPKIEGAQDPMHLDVAVAAKHETALPTTQNGIKEDKINILVPDLKLPGIEVETRLNKDVPDISVPDVDMNSTGNKDEIHTGPDKTNTPVAGRTVHVPILDLSVRGVETDSPEVIKKSQTTSKKEHRVSQSSDSDTSSSSDNRRKKDKYKFADYSSEDNRDSYLSPLAPLSSHSPLNVSQTLAATSNPNLNGFDKLEASLAHSTPVKVMDGAIPSIVRHRGHFVVVAIDFGTTFSGYALSFTRDPESVHMMRNWEGGDPGVINQKTPTTILLSPEGEFDSFGFTARDRYHNLTPDEVKRWLYFERFKMVLHHNPDLTRDTMLKASNGQAYPALKVFALAIRFFKEHALQQLTDQSGITIVNDDVRWVITVPAIWKAPAKQFMRQAAYEADLVSPDCPDQLLIALEPEAASIYCRKLRMYQLVPEHPEWRPLQSPRYSTPEPLNDHLACSDIRDDVARPPFDLPPDFPLESKIKGTRYMVVDCGGGTVDITVHELGEDTKLKELYKATGGPYGATAVDDEFINMLCDIFGHEFIAHYRAKYPIGWLNLMINFESRKRSASPFKNNSLNVSLPFTFIDYFKKQKGGHIDSVVKKYGNKEVCWSSEGMLRLSPHAMRCLFVPVMEKIKHTIGDILNHPNARNLKYLFLVGGFAESPILQHDIRKEFSSILKVLIPTGVSLAILKGAVLFGLDPTIVNIRRSRLTYGVGVLNRFDPSKHPTSKLVHRDGVDWCTDVFDVFVQVDQPVALGDTVIRSYTPAKVNQLISVIHIYSSEDTDAPFITDPGVRKCGTLCLDLSDLEADSLPSRREIQARMMFGDTEIKVSALDVATGRCVRASIDFLNK